MTWKWNKNVGLLLLAIWLIVSGLEHFGFFSFSLLVFKITSITPTGIHALFAGLAIVAGVFILLDR